MALDGLIKPGVKRVTGSSSLSWRRLVDGATATAALTALPSWTVTQPSGGAVIEPEGYSALKLMIGGTDGDAETINFDVIGWHQISGNPGTANVWVPFRIAEGVAYLASAITYGTGGANLGASTNMIADKIVSSTGAPTNGQYVFSPDDGAQPAYMELLTRNCQLIEIRTDLGTAATADVFAQLGEPSAEFAAAAAAGVAVDIVSAPVDLAAAGTRDILAAPGAGLALWIYDMVFTCGAQCTVQFIDSTATDLTGDMPIGANGGANLSSDPLWKCAANTKLQATLAGAGGTLDGFVRYAIVAQ